MEISLKDWIKYKDSLSRLSKKASEEVLAFIRKNGGYANIERQTLIDFAFGIATKYGEGSAALAAQMYDAVAILQNAGVPEAIPAPTATYSEVAKAINGTIKNTGNENVISESIGRLVKQTGCDTIKSNAYRDRNGKGTAGMKKRHSGAEVAWIPVGDTCSFCIMLASEGWQRQTQWAEGYHAEHIHANCDCTYAVRFSSDMDVAGYDPDKYLEMYDDAEGSNYKEKLNSMRRDAYQENKDKINEQKRIAYGKRVEELNASAAEEIDVN